MSCDCEADAEPAGLALACFRRSFFDISGLLSLALVLALALWTERETVVLVRILCPFLLLLVFPSMFDGAGNADNDDDDDCGCDASLDVVSPAG